MSSSKTMYWHLYILDSCLVQKVTQIRIYVHERTDTLLHVSSNRSSQHSRVIRDGEAGRCICFHVAFFHFLHQTPQIVFVPNRRHWSSMSVKNPKKPTLRAIFAPLARRLQSLTFNKRIQHMICLSLSQLPCHKTARKQVYGLWLFLCATEPERQFWISIARKHSISCA